MMKLAAHSSIFKHELQLRTFAMGLLIGIFMDLVMVGDADVIIGAAVDNKKIMHTS